MTPTPTLDHQEIIRIRLRLLTGQHRDLDAAIHALAQTRTADPLALRRLKKQKLALKDAIASLEDELTPDIIA